MKILITGGAGFVGANLAVKFTQTGNEVVCIDNLARRGSENNLTRLSNNNIRFIHADIRNTEDLESIQFSPDVVLECSAQTTAVDGYSNPVYDFTNNTVGVINVLEFCRKKGAGIIFWSSNKVYNGDLCNLPPVIENDTRFEWSNENFLLDGWSKNGFNEKLSIDGGNHTIYGVTKAAADLFCQEWASAFEIPVIVNRLSCLYGPHQFGMVSQGWVVWFALAKSLGIDLTFYGFGGKQVRDYLHIDDLFRLIDMQIASIELKSGSVYNVGGGIENTTSVLELSNRLDTMIGKNGKINHGVPRREDQKIFVCDISKVSSEFNWKPVISIDEGLSGVLDWIESEDLSWVSR